MEIKIQFENGGMMPTKEFESAIGYDLYLPKDVIVNKGRQVIPLGFRVALPYGVGAFIFNRSGVSAKGMQGFHLNNDVQDRFDCDVQLGLVDPLYRGQVGLLINNHDEPFMLRRGSSVAQMVLIGCCNPQFHVVDELDMETERGEEGFKA